MSWPKTPQVSDIFYEVATRKTTLFSAKLANNSIFRKLHLKTKKNIKLAALSVQLGEKKIFFLKEAF